MKRIPDKDWFSITAFCSVLEVSQGTLYAMIKTGEVLEPVRDDRGRQAWPFYAVADTCLRQISRWLDEDPFQNLFEYPARRCTHSRQHLEELRSWIERQVAKRRNFGSPAQAAEWHRVREEGERQLARLGSMSPINQRQRLGEFFARVRTEGTSDHKHSPDDEGE